MARDCRGRSPPRARCRRPRRGSRRGSARGQGSHSAGTDEASAAAIAWGRWLVYARTSSCSAGPSRARRSRPRIAGRARVARGVRVVGVRTQAGRRRGRPGHEPPPALGPRDRMGCHEDLGAAGCASMASTIWRLELPASVISTSDGAASALRRTSSTTRLTGVQTTTTSAVPTPSCTSVVARSIRPPRRLFERRHIPPDPDHFRRQSPGAYRQPDRSADQPHAQDGHGPELFQALPRDGSASTRPKTFTSPSYVPRRRNETDPPFGPDSAWTTAQSQSARRRTAGGLATWPARLEAVARLLLEGLQQDPFQSLGGVGTIGSQRDGRMLQNHLVSVRPARIEAEKRVFFGEQRRRASTPRSRCRRPL